VKNIKILILEDDLETVEKILAILKKVEEEEQIAFGATVLPDYVQTEEFINKNPHIKFDILLLDRDCFLGGSFHTVNLDNFDKNKVISISSVSEYNRKAQEMGIKRTILKEFTDLDKFANTLKNEVKSVVKIDFT